MKELQSVRLATLPFLFAMIAACIAFCSNAWSACGFKAEKIAASGDRTCALEADGTAVCWGKRFEGTPVVDDAFVDVVVGAHHACGLRDDGTVRCWGSNSFNQLVPPPGPFVQIAAGYAHNCGIKNNGTVSCWGSNDEGQASLAQLRLDFSTQ